MDDYFGEKGIQKEETKHTQSYRGSISCFQNWHGNMNFKMKKYQWKPTNCHEFDAYKCRLAAILFVPGQIYNFRPKMKKIFMDYENS